MNWDKGIMEVELEALVNVRDQLWRAYNGWSKASHLRDGMDGLAEERLKIGFYEGYAKSIEDMGRTTRFAQLEHIVGIVHAHGKNVELLNDCIQQVKDEMG